MKYYRVMCLETNVVADRVFLEKSLATAYAERLQAICPYHFTVKEIIYTE